ncbi:NAD-glutamate dehydrogenase [soil metagenome]
MSVSSTTLLDEVLERIGDTSGPLVDFARAYLRRIPWDVEMSPEAVYHEVVGLFGFIESRPGPISVRVHNPTVATHGYESDGTVVEVNAGDSPFLVDSITNELQSRGVAVVRVLHPVIGTTRDQSGRLMAVQPAARSEVRESVQHYVLDGFLDPDELPALEERLGEVLRTVVAAVSDFHAMVETAGHMADLARAGAGQFGAVEVDEAVAFLEWLRNDNFVFLGYREYRISETPNGPALQGVTGSGLGILSDAETSKAADPILLSSLPSDVADRYEQGDLLVISKTNRLSVVHRRARMDYVGIRMIGSGGETVGEARLLGLFTSKAYMESVLRIPVLRQKVAEIAAVEDLIEGSHDHKEIVALVEGFPKDELFGLPSSDLRRVLMGLLALQERAQVRLFVRRDLLDRGVRILVAMPRDRYSSELGRRLQELFLERFGGTTVDYHLTLSRSDLARLHFTVWVPNGEVADLRFEALEAEVAALARSWSERVQEELAGRHGFKGSREIVGRWAHRLPRYYTASTHLAVAAGDMEHLDELTRGGRRSLVGLQNEVEGPDILTRIALYEMQGKRPLSVLMPALEDMGLRVIEEVPTRLSGAEDVFIHDFGVLGPHGGLLDLEACSERVAGLLAAVWEGSAESDSLNRLVLAAGLDRHQVAILRAYETYWRRVSSIFTVKYVNDTLAAHPEIAAVLVRLFELRFAPDSDDHGYAEVRDEIVARLDAVPSLDEDRILRGFLRLIEATVRTNAYRAGRQSLAFKLHSAEVPDMPTPRPLFEVFVIGDDVEGIHLRAGRRARGGIRWSERREDYRTEVLGLMKAQVTKNSIIVPTGAKGGFVLRRPPTGHEALQEALRSGYEVFIRGLLDITDNLIEGEVVHPDGVRVHDDADPYLVVAADKGTARFSDTANRIAKEYSFWLDDAFGSGGATGYDHKQLGITARGAWKSLERHLLQEGIDPHTESFSAVGIGDMSGDVFGNGMLGSETIGLVAAFDHRHILIDPNPDAVVSFRERKRLFDLPGSSWDDYDRDLLSEGGGVYSRSAKQIELSPAARLALDSEAVGVTPAELIRIILQAPVDLLWNGGIGTYVKATEETNEEVGDRTNDSLRVNGSDLRCRVVVEGGNLGFTQRGRIEYAGSGGKINTDFIDNSGGVNCSDREVNLKILLRMAETRGEIGRAARDELMDGQADSVVDSILHDSYSQAQVLTIEEAVSADHMDAYEQLMVALEGQGMLDRALECLPSTQQLAERARAGMGLSRPELAVLLAYAKRSLVEALLSSGIGETADALEVLRHYFPGQVTERFDHLLGDHPLRRELVATKTANDVVDSQGVTFVSRLSTRSGAGADEVVSAYRQARDFVGGAQHRQAIEQLFGAVDVGVWSEMMAANDRLVSTLTRWFLRQGPNGGSDLGSEDPAAEFTRLAEEAGEWGTLQWRLERSAGIDRLRSEGIPAALARRTVLAHDLVHAPDIIAVATASGRSRVDVGKLFFRVGRAFALNALERMLGELKVADSWQRWALESIEDDLLIVRRALAERILAEAGDEPVDESVQRFVAKRAEAVARVVDLARSLDQGAVADSAPLMVAVRQIEALAY